MYRGNLRYFLLHEQDASWRASQATIQYFLAVAKERGRHSRPLPFEWELSIVLNLFTKSHVRKTESIDRHSIVSETMWPPKQNSKLYTLIFFYRKSRYMRIRVVAKEIKR